MIVEPLFAFFSAETNPAEKQGIRTSEVYHLSVAAARQHGTMDRWPSKSHPSATAPDVMMEIRHAPLSTKETSPIACALRIIGPSYGGF